MSHARNILLTILILINSIPLFGQKDGKFPFQVLDSDNAYLASGRLIKRFDLLSARDIVKLNQGRILLVHYTGIPVTLKGDTLINLKKLSDRISVLSRKISVRRPDVKRLFSLTPIIPPLIDDYKPPFVFPPPRTYLSHNVKDDLCLKWVKGRSDGYTIELRNMFDDSLKSYYSETNYFTIPSEDFQELSVEENRLLISVSVDNKQGSQIECAIFRNSDISGLFQCDVATSDKALMIGYYFEEAGNLVEAETYYRLASSLSEDKVFSEVVDYFEKRTR